LTAFTLAADANLRQIGTAGIWGVATARTGGDTVDINGFKLTIDQDSRYGLSGTTSTTWGNLTINAAKGGEVHVDGTKVWMIPFTGGSGTLTLGTQITIGGVTCNTIGIYTALTAAPATTGASGWLKVTNASGTPSTISSGTYAGFTLTANGAAIRGFIEVNGDEASTINANRLGTFRVTGEWFELGTTSGTSNQTMQCPNNGAARYLAGVFIEATAGAGDYEFWPNAGTTTSTGTDATRGKVVWVDATGLVRIGNSGAATNGHTPTAGRKVVVPNIFFENNTTAARTANVIPNATIATRYDFTCTGGGVIEIDKCNMAWYLSASQAFSVNVSNSGFVDGIYLSEVASPMTFTKVGVGNKPTTALLMSPLTIATCFAGGTFTDCVWARVSMAASGAHTNTLTDMAGFTFVRNTIRANTIRANSTTYALNGTRLQNCVWTSPVIIQGAMVFTTCTNIIVTDTVYCESVSATTVTTYTGTVWNAASNSLNCTFSGLTMPVTNTHPYTALLAVSGAAANIKLRNIGTRASPITMGSVNACGLIYTVATASQDVKVQRVYVSNTRTGIMTGDNSCTRITEENVFGDYADAVDVMACLNMVRKGMGGTGALTGQTSVYGTHWRDGFTSTIAGRIAILMNEATSATASQVSLSGGAAFTSAGGLYMPVIGQSVTFEMPEYILGHTAFANSALVMAGGTATNYTYDYAINKNDGAGWSTMTTSNYTATTLGAALNGVTGIDASKGFKLRLEITTGTTNTTAITSVYITTVSTTTAQDYQYPLDVVPVTVTVLDGSTLTAVQNARVRITTDVGGFVVLEGLTNVSGVLTGTTQYASNAISGTVRRATVADGTLYKPNSIAGTTTSAGFEVTILMASDE
jgi:hypothetical protein